MTPDRPDQESGRPDGMVQTLELRSPADAAALRRTARLLSAPDPALRVIILRVLPEPGGGQSPIPDAAAGREAEVVADLLDLTRRPLIALLDAPLDPPLAEIALACHWRFATTATTFSFVTDPFGSGRASRLDRVVSPDSVRRLPDSPRIVDSAAALSLAILQEVFPGRQPADQAALQLAESLSAGAPVAQQLIITAVREGIALPLPRALAVESALFALSLSTADSREGVAAFLERRQPRFRGLCHKSTRPNILPP